MDGDRERWNARWHERAGHLETEALLLSDHADLFPRQGKALDLACGAGRNGIWLAKRGMDVTLVDVSDVAIEKAQERAHGLGLSSMRERLRGVNGTLAIDGRSPGTELTARIPLPHPPAR